MSKSAVVCACVPFSGELLLSTSDSALVTVYCVITGCNNGRQQKNGTVVLHIITE